MRIIPADYNAATTAGALRLNFHDSRRALHDLGAKPGDWAWLSDGEVVVGARLEADPEIGLVGVPRWETLTHLDDPGADDFARVWAEFQHVSQGTGRSPEKQIRSLQLLTTIEAIVPPAIRGVIPLGYLSVSRAGALYLLGEFGLALIEIEDALKSCPDYPFAIALYLEILRQVDLKCAFGEAEVRAGAPDASAEVLAACVNIWTAVAANVDDDQFPAIGRQVLEWLDRFDGSPGRERMPAAGLAQIQFNRWLILLRLGLLDEARAALDKAHDANPKDDVIVEARVLNVFDDRARSIAERFHSKTQPLIAA